MFITVVQPILLLEAYFSALQTTCPYQYALFMAVCITCIYTSGSKYSCHLNDSIDVSVYYVLENLMI